jgi:hypothetical protein
MSKENIKELNMKELFNKILTEATDLIHQIKVEGQSGPDGEIDLTFSWMDSGNKDYKDTKTIDKAIDIIVKKKKKISSLLYIEFDRGGLNRKDQETFMKKLKKKMKYQKLTDEGHNGWSITEKK